jgi:BMFP domain-containing protein YqiC
LWKAVRAGVAEVRPSAYFRAERGVIMQSENRIFDDFVKMVNGFAGTMAGMGREAEASAREKMREWMGGMDFVSRDEFEAVKAMAAKACEENDALKARVAALEAKLGGTASKAAPKRKPGAKS